VHVPMREALNAGVDFSKTISRLHTLFWMDSQFRLAGIGFRFYTRFFWNYVVDAKTTVPLIGGLIHLYWGISWLLDLNTAMGQWSCGT